MILIKQYLPIKDTVYLCFQLKMKTKMIKSSLFFNGKYELIV